MTLAVHYLQAPGDEYEVYLRETLAPEVNLSLGSRKPVPPETQILITGRPDREHLAAAPVLETMIIPCAGLPPETRVLMAEHPSIAVHNLRHNAVPVAELALALLLAAAKCLLPLDRALWANDWRPRYWPGPSDEDGRANTHPATFPFHELENVVMSPDRTGATSESNRMRMDHLATLLNAAARGDPLPNRVDLAVGY